MKDSNDRTASLDRARANQLLIRRHFLLPLTLFLFASASEEMRMSSRAMAAPMATTTDSHTAHPAGLTVSQISLMCMR